MAARWQCCSLSSAFEPSGSGQYIDTTFGSKNNHAVMFTCLLQLLIEVHQKNILVMMSPPFVVTCVCI